MGMKFLEGQKSGKVQKSQSLQQHDVQWDVEPQTAPASSNFGMASHQHPNSTLSLDIVHIAAAAPLALPGEEPPTAHRHALISSCLS